MTPVSRNGTSVRQFSEFSEVSFALSPSMYRRVHLKAAKKAPLGSLLADYKIGEDPGSMYYLSTSPVKMVRTRALQAHSHLIYPKGESLIPVNPNAVEVIHLQRGDILLSKDSNIGMCAIIDGPSSSHTLSGGVVRLRAKDGVDPFYLFSFLKHELFTTQLRSMVPKGSTIAHAKTLWLDCEIPLPVDSQGDDAASLVAALCEAIVNKESKIRVRDSSIRQQIDNELSLHQQSSIFRYEKPTVRQFGERKRLDAAIYGEEYQQAIFPVLNYTQGYKTTSEAGFTVTPGPSLEIKLLGTRVDSDTPRDGFYELIIPANISEWGTVAKRQWIGTRKDLALLQRGDVLIGEAGFQKGRSIVVVDEPSRTTTNAHGLYARRTELDLVASVFFRCMFNWYRERGLIDLMAVGGSGGHFSPEYFESILVPNFPDAVRADIAALYSSESDIPFDAPDGVDLVEHHRARDVRLGIHQLDKDIKELKALLTRVQTSIIEGSALGLDSSDAS